jgi:3-oxoadipate enol-lactonase
VTAVDLRVSGTGPAVLWIHGYTMDSSVWRPLWDLLPGWRHIGVDLPGHGGSRPVARSDTLPGLAAELAGLAAAERAHRVVALSFGSMVALQMAIDAPGVVRRLVVGAPTIAGAPPEPGTGPRYRDLIMLKRGGATGERLADLWMSSPPDIFRGTERHPDMRAELRSVIARHSWRELDTGAMYGLTRHVHTEDALGRIRAATLAVIGDDDMPTFAANADLLGKAVPGCRVLRLPEAGHLCLIERPEAVAPAVAAHLAAHLEEGDEHAQT